MIDFEQLGTLLLGSGLEGAAYERQNKKQKALAEQRRAYQAEQARGSNAAIESYIASLKPEARAAEQQAIQRDLASGLQKSVGEVAKYEAPENFAGKVSGRYVRAKAEEEAEVDRRLKDAIERMSVAGTPHVQDVNRRFALNTAAGDVNQANIASNNVGNAFSQAINLQRPDPFLRFAGETLRGLGMAKSNQKPARKKSAG